MTFGSWIALLLGYERDPRIEMDEDIRCQCAILPSFLFHSDRLGRSFLFLSSRGKRR
jgi:hypothetical protein